MRKVAVLQCFVVSALVIVLIGQIAFLVGRPDSRPASIPNVVRPVAESAQVFRDLVQSAAPEPSGSNPQSEDCDDWSCARKRLDEQLPTSLPRNAPPPPRGPPQPALSELAPPPKGAEPVKLNTPQHCDADGGSQMTHTGKDYFCCNRAADDEMDAVVSDSMTDYIATGGRFPIMIVSYDRAEMLDNTLTSLLKVRCVRKSDVFIVQDGNNEDVARIVKKHGVGHHQKLAAPVLRGEEPDGAARIAQHYGYSLGYMMDTAFPRAPAVIVAEDDFLFSPDWYEYFHAVAPALESDPTLWLASSWVSAIHYIHLTLYFGSH
jgi:hypothetical protein